MSNSMLSPGKGAGVLLPDTSEQEFGNMKWLRWWYRLCLPPKPEEGASFDKQDVYRRARLAGTLLILMLTIMSFAFIVSLLSRSYYNLLVVGSIVVLLLICTRLNRAGLLIIEGLIIVGVWTVGIVGSFVFQGTLSIGTTIQYDLLTVALLLAVTFFPAWSVFVVAIFNCVFTIVSINVLNHDRMLTDLIKQEGIGKVVTRPIALTVVIMIIMWLWARSSHYALQRADRAEMIARLQYDLADRDREISTQKMQLEHSVQQIIDTLMKYSNGNLSARIPLNQENVLWNAAGPINNLLNRVQRMRHAEVEVDRLNAMLQQARQENMALRNALQKQSGMDNSHQRYQ